MMASRLSTSLNGVVTDKVVFREGWRRALPVRIETEDVDSRLKWGMTIEVTFEALEK
jgi:hypothetical protein